MTLALTFAVLLSAQGPATIENDYKKALKTAKQQKKLLFVDAWAPWCHSCVFMREHVLTKPEFKAFEKKVVFAGIDTEQAKNAAFLEKFPVNVWPTLFFIDPATERIAFTWIGSADAAQMTALLEAASGQGALKEADALLAKGDLSAAAESYLQAREKGADASSRGLLSMLSALALSEKHEACAKTAQEQAGTITGATDKVNVLAWGIGCALELPAGADRKRLLDAMVVEAQSAVKAEGALADDVSGLYEMLTTERQAAKDDDGVKKVALEWLTYLEAAAAKSPTPAARAVFDPHRLNASLAMGEPHRAVPHLMASEVALPKDYNPASRLALAYRELGQLDEGLAAIDRALKKCSGPRKLRLYDTKASLLEKKNDTAGQRKVLLEALAYGKKLPKPQRSEKRLAALQERVDALPAAEDVPSEAPKKPTQKPAARKKPKK